MVFSASMAIKLPRASPNRRKSKSVGVILNAF
jgi:hypothetical protein